MTTEKVQASRREFVRRAAYVPPLILTLAVAPSYAKTGSVKERQNGSRRRERQTAEREAVEKVK